MKAHSQKIDLELVAKWIEAGTLRIDIDSVFQVSDIDKAWERNQDSTKKVPTLIQIDDACKIDLVVTAFISDISVDKS